uniref:Uncharacterized protein n=1 Tax=Propithecus coquereli TaxID=379532 RepID=A0A2K6FF69_PROCO
TKRMMRMRTPQYLISNTGQSGDAGESGHRAAARPVDL